MASASPSGRPSTRSAGLATISPRLTAVVHPKLLACALVKSMRRRLAPVRAGRQAHQVAPGLDDRPIAPARRRAALAGDDAVGQQHARRSSRTAPRQSAGLPAADDRHRDREAAMPPRAASRCSRAASPAARLARSGRKARRRCVAAALSSVRVLRRFGLGVFGGARPARASASRAAAMSWRCGFHGPLSPQSSRKPTGPTRPWPPARAGPSPAPAASGGRCPPLMIRRHVMRRARSRRSASPGSRPSATA